MSLLVLIWFAMRPHDGNLSTAISYQLNRGDDAIHYLFPSFFVFLTLIAAMGLLWRDLKLFIEAGLLLLFVYTISSTHPDSSLHFLNFLALSLGITYGFGSYALQYSSMELGLATAGCLLAGLLCGNSLATNIETLGYGERVMVVCAAFGMGALGKEKLTEHGFLQPTIYY